MAFLNLVLLLGTLASQRLDGVRTCEPDDRNTQLHRARENIDMLLSLKKRTSGRLNPEEEKVLATLASELQTKYVQTMVYTHRAGIPGE